MVELTVESGSGEVSNNGADTSDMHLVLAAYRHWGVDCVHHLRGDWSFAMWDEAQQRLLLARDATGLSSLFWWQGPEGVLFANNLPVMVEAPLVPQRPSLRWALGMLMVFNDPAEPCDSGYEGVSSLPPGHCAVFEQGSCRVLRWWQPEALQPFEDAPIEAFEGEFLRLYAQAVSRSLERRSGGVAAMLSGGLDSGSVVALAAPMLAVQQIPLRAYAHVPSFEPPHVQGRVGNEWALAQATAGHVGNVDLTACDSASESPLAAMEDTLRIHGLPVHAGGNVYWYQDIVRRAAADGASVLLCARAGNQTVSYAGSASLWPAVQRGAWAHVWAELRSELGGIQAGFKQRLVKPALRPLRAGLRRLRAASNAPVPWASYAWVSPGPVQVMQVPHRMAAAAHDPRFLGQPSARRWTWRIGMLQLATGDGPVNVHLGGHAGLDVRDPTTDQDLMEFCLRVPESAYWAHGLQRGFIRQTMRDYLPNDVLLCKQRGLQSSDLSHRVAAHAGQLVAQVDQVTRHPLVCELIDVERLSLMANGIADGQDFPSQQVHHLLRSLHVAMFLARF